TGRHATRASRHRLRPVVAGGVCGARRVRAADSYAADALRTVARDPGLIHEVADDAIAGFAGGDLVARRLEQALALCCRRDPCLVDRSSKIGVEIAIRHPFD